MNRVYICSRYAGNIDLNVKNARALCRLALDEGASPIAPHLLYPQVLDDGDPDQRLVGRMAALSWVAACDEVWVYADDRGPSEGMIAEIAYAEALEKPVRRIDREMKDITGSHSGNLGDTIMREYEVRVEFYATVKLPLPDGEEAPNCCDPDNEMTDREAIESAISSAISQRCEVFVYGEDREPAQVFIDLDLSNDVHVEGFEDDIS